MKNLLKQLEKISESIGKTVSYLMLVMTLITVFVVIARYLFNFGSIAMQDSIIYLHATIVVLAMGYSLQTDAHVRVDVFYQKMKKKQKAAINIFGTLFFLLPFCVLTFWVCFPGGKIRRSRRFTGGIFTEEFIIGFSVCVNVTSCY
jgi:TRAP-type mannitol/chloroaromatic compound transport system permease small subunit